MESFSLTEFNRTTIPKGNSTKNRRRKNYNINMLLSAGEFNFNKRKDYDFYSNKTNFFRAKNNIKYNVYNKTDIKFPIIKIQQTNKLNNTELSKLSKTVNNNKIDICQTEGNNAINRIYTRFEMCNQKYNDVTKYFKFFIKTGNDNTKFRINNNPYHFQHISCVSKPKSRKYCYNAFQRIKSLQ